MARKQAPRRAKKPLRHTIEPVIKGFIAWVGTFVLVGGIGIVANGIRSL
ncbi:hypothetical protein [Thiothrix fructosivorans]|uniref:Uncharacterized protein n=1 Tax=Thiothrix fructosivorans TaxID=111770 RepID=A0A8B0SQZ9_9GAMM|nr:hypothetical protein [Thiothrix fructosivorans]MBO0612072.1 hypothetical protein [Thiothrix fructosivorans]QTX12428.1 hypothetical protein J1836_008930 [Thiothrix fructosivorans]